MYAIGISPGQPLRAANVKKRAKFSFEIVSTQKKLLIQIFAIPKVRSNICSGTFFSVPVHTYICIFKHPVCDLSYQV
jgi:peroxiredoxin